VTPRSYPVVIAKCAADDIDAAVSFIALDSPLEAERWYEGCIDAIRSLAELPRIWPPPPSTPLPKWASEAAYSKAIGFSSSFVMPTSW
jgi:plasmid stabilization system protein ParE